MNMLSASILLWKSVVCGSSVERIEQIEPSTYAHTCRHGQLGGGLRTGGSGAVSQMARTDEPNIISSVITSVSTYVESG